MIRPSMTTVLNMVELSSYACVQNSQTLGPRRPWNCLLRLLAGVFRFGSLTVNLAISSSGQLGPDDAWPKALLVGN